jgi:hypothetical protein
VVQALVFVAHSLYIQHTNNKAKKQTNKNKQKQANKKQKTNALLKYSFM